MVLFGLLLVPVILGLGGLLFSKGRVTLKEFFVHEAVVIIIIASGYFIAFSGMTADTELWNGVVAKKWQGTQHCCHSYPCNPHPCNCDSKGSCSTCWDTCYRHSRDINWNAESSNGEGIYSNGCNAPNSSAPARWNTIVIGEPTAVEHGYTNYIKGNPDSILRRTGAAERFAGKLPSYPTVYDYYRANRFLTVGVKLSGVARLNQRLSEINAKLGRAKEVNIIVIAVGESDQSYLEAIRETWLGGKKNDVIVVIGLAAMPEAPDRQDIAWAGVVSWTKNEDVKIAIRDRILDLKTFDGSKILEIVQEEVAAKFVRRPWADFDYLKSTLEPPRWALWFLGILGCLISIGLQVHFWIADPFGDGRDDRFGGRYRR
ncbi:MAG: hypothetical protein WCT10_05720 [Patescibacteria group bacterium]|jgi:hypothetical protein